jgi:large subunit ribosomal protein L22
MTGPKTNERPGTRAVLRHARIAPNKVREVLNLIRGTNVQEAAEILRFSERDAALLIGKLLASAVANAENNDGQDAEELYVSACFADEGTTIKRWRPRARGRATRIRKRTSHITVIVSRLPQDQIDRLVARRRAEVIAQRARRVAGAQRRGAEAGGDPGESRATRRARRRGGDDVAVTDVPDDEFTETESIDEAATESEVAANEVAANEAFEAELDDAEVLDNAEVSAPEAQAADEAPAAEEVVPEAGADKESE